MMEFNYSPRRSNQMSTSLNGLRRSSPNYRSQRRQASPRMTTSLTGIRDKFAIGNTTATRRFQHQPRGMAVIEDDDHSNPRRFATNPCIDFPALKLQHQQDQQEQRIRHQERIAKSMNVLMESMKRTATSRKLVQQFQSKISSSSSSSSSSSKSKSKSKCCVSPSKHPTITKAKRYATKSTTKRPLKSAMKKKQYYSPPSTSPRHHHNCIPSEITIITPISKKKTATSYYDDRRCEDSSRKNYHTTYYSRRHEMMMLAADASPTTTRRTHATTSCHRHMIDDDLSIASSVIFDDIASFSSAASPCETWLRCVE